MCEMCAGTESEVRKNVRSENCTLELKFGRQMGKPIVPVLMQDGWKATGWLGILTAGAVRQRVLRFHWLSRVFHCLSLRFNCPDRAPCLQLWTPIFDMPMVRENVDKLISQLALTVEEDGGMPQWAGVGGDTGQRGVGEVEVAVEEEESLTETKHELQRFLRREQPVSVAAAATAAATAEATLPAEVPEPPPFMMVTPDMDEAKALLMRQLGGRSETVVVIGMGGIGKTTYCSWLCHQQQVLANFEKVVWLTLGQEADVDRLLQLVYLQLEGQELPPSLSKHLVKEFVKQAMADKRLLLVIDDAWDKSELQQLLALVDRKTDSKALVSSRLHGLAGESSSEEITEIKAQLPSMADAVRLLLGTAGLADVQPPAEAEQIVRQCSHLPLALGMCGKILKGLSLGADDSWQGVLDIIQEVMNESDEQRTIEESVILASLKNMSEDAKTMFYSLGLCAEDAVLPLEVLAVFFEATKRALGGVSAPTDRPISIMYARRLVKQLLDRSLVLGRVDCASLHDIVREHARSKMDERQTLAAHKAIVEHFVRTRPSGTQGWYQVEHPLAEYAAAHLRYHMSLGWEGLSDSQAQEAGWQSDTVAVRWLTAGNVGFLDTISVSSGAVLGVARCSELASRHSAAGEFWQSAVCWAVVARTIWSGPSGRSPEMYTALRACTDSLADISIAPATGVSAVPAEHRDRLELFAVIKTFQSWDPALQMPLMPNILRLAPQPIAREDPVTAHMSMFMADALPCWFGGDPDGFGRAVSKIYNLSIDVAYRKADEWSVDGRTQDLLAVLSLGYPCAASHWELMLRVNDQNWNIFGPNGEGEYLKRAWATYSFERHHMHIAEIASGDIAGPFVTSAFLTSMHWGDLTYGRAEARKNVSYVRRARSEGSTKAIEAFYCLMNANAWFLLCLGLRAEAAEMIEDTPFAVEGVEADADADPNDDGNPVSTGKHGSTAVVRTHIKDQSMIMHNAAGVTNIYRLLHVLLADPAQPKHCDRAVALLASVPESPHDLAMMSIPTPVTPMPTLCYHSGLSPCALAAFVFAKIGLLEKAEGYANEALLGDQTRGGDTLPSTRIFALIVVGMAKSSHAAAAATVDAAFADAIKLAEETGELLYAIFACFCWQRAVAATVADSSASSTAARAAASAAQWSALTTPSRVVSSEAELTELCEVVWRPLHQ